MSKSTLIGLGLFSMIAVQPSLPLGAQWITVRDKNLPRTSSGQPDLTAPTRRTPDGKPDLSGIWVGIDLKYLFDLASDFKPGELPMQAWAEALTRERAQYIHASEESDSNCLPQGVPKIYNTPSPFKIIQQPERITILYEAFAQFRQIHLDGRALPGDPNPAWLGYSVGRWDSDTLVVTSSGFNGKTWLDHLGHPATEALKVTERIRRPDIGHLEMQFTIDDPKAYTKPWIVNEKMRLLPDAELIEYVCNENEKDVRHFVDKPKQQ